MTTGFLVSLLLFGASNADDKPAKAKLERNDKLEGTWVEGENVWVINGNEITAYDPSSRTPSKSKFKIDSTTKPMQIDFEAKFGLLLGIYEVKGDTMKYCIERTSPRRQPAARPTEFKTVQGETILRTFERREPAAGTAVKIRETFLENEALADVTYTSRMVTVTGTVQRIQRDEGGYVVEVSSKPVPLLFSFEYTTRHRLARLKKGEEVTIQGICFGKRHIKGNSGEEAIFFAGSTIIEAKE